MDQTYFSLPNNNNDAMGLSGNHGQYVNFSGATRSFRSKPPADFILKIESFSSLSAMLYNSGPEEKYESSIFEAGGYNWKLSIYPNGNKRENGKGYISLYLVLADANNLPHGFEVNVNFKLFVYDHFCDKYLTVQDAVGRVQRFHSIKSERGFAQFLPKNVFWNASNGFLVDGSCVFGAEVFVFPDKQTKVESLSMIKEHGYSMKINSLSIINETSQSQVFNAVGSKWRLTVCPREDEQGLHKYLGLFLELMGEFDNNTTCGGQKRLVEVTLRIRDQLFDQHMEITSTFAFDATATQLRFNQFMLLSDLNDPYTGFVVDDFMIVEAEFSPIFYAKNGAINRLPLASSTVHHA